MEARDAINGDVQLARRFGRWRRMFRGRRHGQHGETIGVGVPEPSVEDTLAVLPQDLVILISGQHRGGIQLRHSTLKRRPPPGLREKVYDVYPTTVHPSRATIDDF